MSEGAARERRALELFEEWIALPQAEREQRRAALGREDPLLCALVEELLAWEERGAARFERAAVGLEQFAASALSLVEEGFDGQLPESVGPFRPLRLLGAGSAGMVYEAEQQQPKRRVALKVLRPGGALADRVRRFQREVQLLAGLDHPGIVRILSAGATDSGLLYFAMELVEGEPFFQVARRGPRRAALELFARLCDAVDCAHQRGIVHRDLKPANVLVDRRGEVRVLDFGIARAADGGEHGGTLHTEAGTLLGTLTHMSPEQARADGRGIDVRADVYALGVLLYELLAGRPPLDLSGLAMHRALAVLAEEEPLPLWHFDRSLRGDLATIVHTALQKDPDRRYRSAGDLARDIRSHLAHQPIAARPPGRWYRARRFVRRNRVLVSLSAGVFLVLAGAALHGIVRTQDAQTARNAAEAEAARARFEAYVAAIGGAAAAMGAGDAQGALDLLDQAPPSERGFEWHHWRARLDQSAEVWQFEQPILALASQGAAFLVLEAPGRLWHFASGANGAVQRPIELQPLEGGPFVRAALSKDLANALTLDAAGRVRLHRTEGGPSREVALQPNALGLALDPLGRRFAVVARNHVVWYGEAGEEPRQAPWRGRHAVAFSGDGNILYTGSVAGQLLALDWDSGQERELLRERPSEAAHVLSVGEPFGVAVGCQDRRVFVWRADGGPRIGPLVANAGALAALALSPDGSQLATGGSDGLLRVFALDGSGTAQRLAGHRGEVTHVAWRPDGGGLISAGVDRTVRLWPELPEEVPRMLRGHEGWVYPAIFTRGEREIWSGGWDGTVRAFGAELGEPLGVRLALETGGAVLELVPSPDGSQLLMGQRRAALTVLDATTGTRLRSIQTPAPATVEALAFHPGGDRFAAFRYDGFFQPDGRLGLHRWPSGEWISDLSVPTSGLAGLAFHPHSGDLYLTTASTTLRLDAEGQVLAQVASPRGGAALAISPDGALLVTGHGDGDVWIRDPGSLAPLDVLRGHHGPVYALAFHPDGTRLASGARDGQIALWDVPRRRRVARLLGHENYVYSLAFSSDGTRLVSGSGDGAVGLWDTVPAGERRRARKTGGSAGMEAVPARFLPQGPP